MPAVTVSANNNEGEDLSAPAKRQRTDDGAPPDAIDAQEKSGHLSSRRGSHDNGLSLLCAASLIQQTGVPDGQQPSASQYAKSPTSSQPSSTNDDVETTTTSTAATSVSVVAPGQNDVLCGRGGLINKHTGNIVYRRVVDHNKPVYKQVPKPHRQLVSQSIVQAILNRGGRFLIQCDENQNWKEINFRRAVQKTSQALREKEVPTEQQAEIASPPLPHSTSSEPEEENDNVRRPKELTALSSPSVAPAEPSTPPSDATTHSNESKVSSAAPPGSPVSTVSTGMVTAV